MSKEKRVIIVYNYGANLYEVYWISQHGNEIYHGPCLKDKNFHFSHHKDGKRHLKFKGQYLSLGSRIPISEIKDIYNLQNINVGDEAWAQKYYPSYNNKRLENIVLVDTRLFSNISQIQIELYLIKPDSLYRLSEGHFKQINKNDYRLIQIIQDITPWLVVHIRNLKHV
jgi:hypothetical protein